MVRIGLVQTTTGIDPDTNARALEETVDRLAGAGADMVFTPEMSGVLDRDARRLRARGLVAAAEPTLGAMKRAAARHGIWIAIGSLAIEAPDGRLWNRSFVIAPDGAVAQTYDKLHLFDVDLGPGGRHQESGTYAAGEAVRLVRTPWGLVGLSICYDVRFPALYQTLARAGAGLIAVPAAFTPATGAAHWHVLLRARAIETGCFIVAAAQCGAHADGRHTFGHSLVVNPWGEILCDMGTEPGTAMVTIDPAEVGDARRRIPNLAAARPLPPAEVAP